MNLIICSFRRIHVKYTCLLVQYYIQKKTLSLRVFFCLCGDNAIL